MGGGSRAAVDEVSSSPAADAAAGVTVDSGPDGRAAVVSAGADGGSALMLGVLQFRGITGLRAARFRRSQDLSLSCRLRC